MTTEVESIAVITTDFPEKFGIPRQSGLAEGATGRIRFEKKYCHPDAVRGLDSFDRLWLLWHFDGIEDREWAATVRPPHMGGNERIGVFATRSPFRPNPIGLSCVKLEKIEYTENGPELIVSGVDLKNGTKIYDIKPYLPYADSYPEAKAGFTEQTAKQTLTVNCPEECLEICTEKEREVILTLLSLDPRPAYQNDPKRIYGMKYKTYDIHFRVEETTLYVTDIQKPPK